MKTQKLFTTKKTSHIFITTLLCCLFAQNVIAQQWSPITNNNIWNLNSGNVGVGTTNPLSKLDVYGEIRSNINGVSNLRLIGGRYAAMLRNDGVDTYFLYTNMDNINGGWNNLRPLRINNSTGDIYLANGSIVMNHNTGNLGIGITNPLYKLDVSNTIRVKNNILIEGEDNNGVGGCLTLKNTAKTANGEASSWKIYNMTGSTYGNSLQFWAYDNTGCSTGGLCQNRFTIMDNGNVGIGYTNPTVELDVKGTIRAKEVKVCLNQGCDFVFEEGYKLMSIKELKKYVQTNNHLPDISPAKEMEKNGINVSEMNAQLLRKIEELTLYLIHQQEMIEALENKLK